MKPENIIDSMNNIDDEIISDAQKFRARKKRKNSWIKWVAVAACFCIAVGAVLGHFHFKPQINPNPPISDNSPVKLLNCSIVNAVYPQMLKYPVETDYDDGYGNFDYDAFSDAINEWYEDLESRMLNAVTADGYSHFFTTSTKTFFADTNGENLVYSPVNVYMALSMLAETTDGQTRQEILDLLGVDNIDELRTLANGLWLSNYDDSGIKTNILANSVWMSDTVSYNKSTLDILANQYYASSFSGEMGSDEYNKALQAWLNEQTGGLLEEQANDVKFNDSTVLGLASTVYFKATWNDTFPEHLTEVDTFYGTKGEENIDFMYQRMTGSPLYYDDNYTATSLSFNSSGKMWFILPDEGTSPESLIQNGNINSILNGGIPANKKDDVIINLYMPKFDVASSMDLIDSIRALGVSKVFSEAESDFTPIMPNQTAYVNQMNHSARVAVDEEGCTAAAFTVIGADTESAPMGEEIDFRLNRPFVFIITSDDSTPLFVGVVNTVS